MAWHLHLANPEPERTSMNFRALCLVGGMLAVSGCSSQASNKPTAPTRTVAVSGAATVPPTTTSSTDPKATTAPVKGATTYSGGRAELAKHNYAAAIASFNSAIAHHDHAASSYAGLGTAYFGTGNIAAGLKAYKRAVALEPQKAAFLYGAAYGSLYARDYHGAVRYAGNLMALKPSNPSGYHLQFLAYGGLLMHHQQVHDATMEVKLQPHNAYAYNDLGISLLNDHQYRRSISAFTHAIAIQGSTYSFYSNRAVAEAYDKQTMAAIHDFEKAKSLDRSPQTRRQIAADIKALQKQLHG